MNYKKIFSLVMLSMVIATLTFIVVVKAEEVEGPRYGGTFLVYAIRITNLNPSIEPIFEFQHLINRRLVALNFNGEPVGDLAESWEVSPDAKTYTFHMTTDAKWWDGKPLTSYDVKYTFENMIEIKGVYASRLELVDKIETPDDYTVVIKLKEPHTAFMYELTHSYYFWIIPAHIFEGTDIYTNPANDDWIGSGPFKIVEWRKDEYIRLERNEEFWKKDEQGNQLPYLDGLIWLVIPDPSIVANKFEVGDLDYAYGGVTLDEAIRLRDTTPNISFYLVWTGYNAIHLDFNLDHPIFSDIRVREAFAHAIDRETLNQKVSRGVFKTWDWQYVGPDYWINRDARLPDYDPEKAEQLLDEAGYPRKTDGTRFKITLSLENWEPQATTSYVIQEDLSKIGVEVELELLEWPTLVEKVSRNRIFDAVLFAGAQGPDPLRLEMAVTTGNNVMNYSNPEVDEAFIKLRSLTQKEERQKWAYRFQEILVQDLPRFNLFLRGSIIVYSTDFYGFEKDNLDVGPAYFDKVWWIGGKIAEPTPSPMLPHEIEELPLIVKALEDQLSSLSSQAEQTSDKIDELSSELASATAGVTNLAYGAIVISLIASILGFYFGTRRR